MPALAPPRRLDSLNRGGVSRSRINQRTAPAPKRAPPRPTCCDSPKIEDSEDGKKVCANCFALFSESDIVADVTFQEDSRGAAQVQGGFVGDTARFARTLGSGAHRRVGGGEKDSAAQIDANGRRELAALCPRLNVPDNVAQQAGFIWSLAAKINFSAGRKTDEVVAACLYAACRRQKDNAILLMDISELLRINVFRLGEVYKDLVKELYLEGGENPASATQLVDVEPLILKYCRKLEFGERTKQVAEDAVKIVRRMKRDWINTGRHPAGLCGACIILAARMNNFRRTVREVVYVAKVADVTVAKRVEEFRRTKSAAMTVDQFRSDGYRLKHQHDPPSFYEAALKQQKFEDKKRRRQIRNGVDETIEVPENEADMRSSRASSVISSSPASEGDIPEQGSNKRRRTEQSPPTPEPSQQTLRVDADGFRIPAVPAAVNPTLGDEQQATRPKKRGRPKKNNEDPQPSIVISEEELATEAELEGEIEEVLEDSQMIEVRNDLEQKKLEERTRTLADQQRELSAQTNRARRDAMGIRYWNTQRQTDGEELTEEDLEAEFLNDPEVEGCILSPEEAAVKEKIWVSFNEDWLRAQHEKEIAKKIAEAEGSHNKAKKGAKGGKRKRRGKKGDPLVTEAGTPIETPGDANAAMLAKRAQPNFSKYVNYETLQRIYGARSSASASRAGSEAPSVSDTSTQNGTPMRPLAPRPSSASPAPPMGMLSPPVTQLAQSAAPASLAVEQPPASPTQPQQPEAEAEEDEEFLEEEEMRDDVSYGSDYAGEQVDDDREDIGEDFYYNKVTNPVSNYVINGTFDDDD